MHNLEERFINYGSGDHELQYRTESGPSPATWSGLREFDLIMTWSFQPDRSAAPHVRLDGDHTLWSQN